MRQENAIHDETPTTGTTATEAISALTEDTEVIFTSEQIGEILPLQYPFALVDKVVEFESDKRAVDIKSVTKNEAYFQGHFLVCAV